MRCETLFTDVLAIGASDGDALTSDRLASFRGLRVVVVGGDDEALAWTLALLPVARAVTLVHDSAQFEAKTELGDAVLAAHASWQIRFVEGALAGLVRERGRLTSITVARGAREQHVPADLILTRHVEMPLPEIEPRRIEPATALRALAALTPFA